MATVTYINDDYETLAEAMQQLVTMGYFASVEYDSENTAVVCKDTDENTVLTIQASTKAIAVSLRLDDGTTKAANVSDASNGVSLYYLYVCSGGAYLSVVYSGGAAYACVIISKTNNNKIGVFSTGGANSAATRLTGTYSVATDDDAVQINTQFSFIAPTIRYQTQLMNIPTCGGPNVVSYFPNVFHTYTSEISYTSNTATPPFNFTQDGKRYLWVGYYAIRDEEAS